jgi:hypothetical protein
MYYLWEKISRQSFKISVYICVVCREGSQQAYSSKRIVSPESLRHLPMGCVVFRKCLNLSESQPQSGEE